MTKPRPNTVTGKLPMPSSVVALSAVVALAFVAFVAWLVLGREGATDPSVQSQASPRAADTASAATAPVDEATSLLGTDSSISSKPLSLVLIATSPGRTPHEGTATLGTDPRNPQTYAAGARLVNGAVIEGIYRDYVILELDGVRTKLTPGRQSVFERFVSGESDSPAAIVGGSANKPLDTLPSSREDLSEIIRPEPVFDDQGFVGLRILAGRYRHKLDALGLKSGDIVRTIDGKPLKSADAAWQLLDDSLSTGSSIVVSIERDGALSSVILDGSRIIESAVQLNTFEMAAPGPPRS